MCLECDGYSHEQAMQALDLQIQVHGWAVVQVQADGPGWGWCYTIGLVEHFGHPELCIVDVDLQVGARTLNHLATQATNRRLPLAQLRLPGVSIHEVHANHLWSDLFGKWSQRYEQPLMPGQMVQVVLREGVRSGHHAPLARRLDRPA